MSSPRQGWESQGPSAQAHVRGASGVRGLSKDKGPSGSTPFRVLLCLCHVLAAGLPLSAQAASCPPLPSLLRTLVIRIRDSQVFQDNPFYISLSTPAKTLFPNKITFTGFRG